MNPRWLIPAVALLGTVLGLGAAWQLTPRGPSDPSSQLVDATVLFGQERPLPEFSLVDHHGKAFTNNELTDRWTLLFFGYTHCPDVCPTTMIDVNAMLAEVRDANVKERLRVTFVSVDPKRDTTERLAQYVPFFNKDFVGVTGADAELAKFAGAFNAFYEIGEPDANGGYLVDHTSRMLLVDPRGRYTAVFGDKPKPKVMAHDLETIIRSYSG